MQHRFMVGDGNWIKTLSALTHRWRQEDLGVRPGEPADRIHEVFSRLGMPPSSQLVQLYMTLGGMDAFEENHWRLWSLKEIEAEARETPPQGGLLFSDYLLNCWCFRLRPTLDGEPCVVRDMFDGTEVVVVAKDIATFIEALQSDPDSVLVPGTGRSPSSKRRWWRFWGPG